MFSTKPPNILGIAPGARQLGLSVFKGKELVFYAVKTIKAEGSKETLVKASNIIKKQITDEAITDVALKKVIFPQQHDSFVKTVFDEIEYFLKEMKIPYSSYEPMTVCATICRDQKPTKRNTTLALAEKYPELTRYVDLTKIWNRRYYGFLLDAIAVGFVHAMTVLEKK